MARTQVYLGAEELELLDRVSAASGASRSELIRRAIQHTYGDKPGRERLAALRKSAGSWRDRDFSGADYVDGIRGDLSDRLRRLNVD